MCTSTKVSDDADATSEFVFVWSVSLCHHRVRGRGFREGRNGRIRLGL